MFTNNKLIKNVERHGVSNEELEEQHQSEYVGESDHQEDSSDEKKRSKGNWMVKVCPTADPHKSCSTNESVVGGSTNIVIYGSKECQSNGENNGCESVETIGEIWGINRQSVQWKK